MNIWKRLTVILLISLSCVSCDQSTKAFASQYLPKHSMQSYLFDFLRIGYAENTGAFLGMGSNLPDQYRFIIFTLIVGIMLGGLLIYLLINRNPTLYSLTTLSLVFAGGFSNFYDRATNNGAVVDFLNIGIGPLRTGIFNIADVAIITGGVAFLFFSRDKKDHHQTPKQV